MPQTLPTRVWFHERRTRGSGNSRRVRRPQSPLRDPRIAAPCHGPPADHQLGSHAGQRQKLEDLDRAALRGMRVTRKHGLQRLGRVSLQNREPGDRRVPATGDRER